MRVLFVITASEFSGPSRHVLWMMEHLLANGHEAGLVCAPEPRLTRAARQAGAAVFPNPHFVRPVRPLKDVRAFLPVFRALRRYQPDLVSAHSTKSGFIARVACAMLRKPVIFTAHGWAFTKGRPRWSQGVALLERGFAPLTRKIICVSEYDRELALSLRVAPPEKLIAIQNGVDPRPFPDRQPAMRDIPVLTTVGRVVPQKDPMTLLEACRRLRGDFRLQIVGDGALLPRVRSFVERHGMAGQVALLGEREDIPELLFNSDVFVMSSRWEGLSRSIIEAMMAGLPVVSTAVGGAAELVEEGVNGYLVPAGDPASLADRLAALIESPELRRSMAAASRERAVQRFTLERMVDQTFNTYEEVLAQDRRRRMDVKVGSAEAR